MKFFYNLLHFLYSNIRIAHSFSTHMKEYFDGRKNLPYSQI